MVIGFQMGRKAKTLTDKQVIQVEALAAALSLEQIADYFGIHRETFDRMRKGNPEIDQQYKKGKSQAIEIAANSLLKQVREGNIAATCFYLKTQAGWKETHALEHSGPEGKPLLPDDVMSAIIKAVRTNGKG